MIYLLDLGERVLLAGSVTTPDMVLAGWVPYYGPVPPGDQFQLRLGILVAVPKEDTDGSEGIEAGRTPRVPG